MSIRGQEQFSFGSGHFIGPAYSDAEFVFHYDSPGCEDFETQARFAGWANGCPVAQELIDPETGRGAEPMLHRYASVNFWFVTISEMALEQNEDLFFRLVASVDRRIDEPVGKFEPVSVPEGYDEEIPPMGTLYGWALPRLMLKQIGDSDDQAVTTDRLSSGLIIMEEAIDVAEDPMELLAWFAEGICTAGNVPAKEVLQTILSAGWLEEHNAVSMINALRGDLQAFAPTLWETYTDMGQTERTALGIV